MRRACCICHLFPLSLAAFIGVTTAAWGQRSPATSGSSSAGAPATRNNTTLDSGATSSGLPPNTLPGLDNTRGIFLSGKVLLDDGARPTSDIRIERVCAGSRPHLEGYADRKGNFSFELGHNTTVDPNVEDSSGGMFNTTSGPASSSGNASLGGAAALSNCQIRAAYPGYRSDTVELAARKRLDDPDVGTIVLHRLQNVLGSTLSVTTALAPKSAQKAYEKGLKLAAEGKFHEAEQKFVAATAIYQGYAIAWFSLGEIQQRQGHVEDARKSYASAIAADSKFVTPYGQLALLAVQDGKWEEAAQFSERVIRLNPIEFPGAFWFNALANYKLHNREEAERSARHLLQLDTARRYPDGELLLGELLIDKHDYGEGSSHLRAYLLGHPDPNKAAEVKRLLETVDEAAREAKK